MNTISKHELKQLIDDSEELVLLEALPASYFDAEHLPGALHFPHDQAERLAASMIPDRASEVVVYCASDRCKNSHHAAGALERLGYSKVRIYTGGKEDWKQSGLPMEPSHSLDEGTQ